ncbi:MAG: DEAD/DEAH box helicase [Spirochaetaceae bacterium]|jgi:ATP-dependent RNA helicase DeaD|nr:DEAD/DEAH box helicase [Spirochaetaceae bacterium]
MIDSNSNHPFAQFGVSDTILAALSRKGWTEPSSIQLLALPRLLSDSGHLIVKARTGTGKTAAFGIPLVERLTTRAHSPRALVLTPTRELALQVSREIASLTTGTFPRITAVYGGTSIRNQIIDLKRGTEIVVGTPGRVMDLMERNILDLSTIEWFILDEADEMLDMGFFEDVEHILKAVKSDRRVALFSATMPEAIRRVIRENLGDIDILEDAAAEDEKPAVDQYYIVVKKEDKLESLRRLIDVEGDFYGLVFCATKTETDEVARRLVEGGYPAEAIHGDLSQEARERTLRRFRSKLTRILVATDVAARGLDIERLTHVINWDLPGDREMYIHRIGRTGRAGRRGKAISLILPADRGRITQLSRSMERVLGTPINWMKVPSIKSLMKAAKEHIRNAVSSALLTPDVSDDTEKPVETLPFLEQLARELIESPGAEQTVQALISLFYGELLDPSRYKAITEFAETAPREEKLFSTLRRKMGYGSRYTTEEATRLYIGIGRKHGASARDIANLLVRAGAIQSRFIDSIEVKEYYAFATVPQEAARRACTFSRRTGEPVIKPAAPDKR